jgi:hypothetical protein
LIFNPKELAFSKADGKDKGTLPFNPKSFYTLFPFYNSFKKSTTLLRTAPFFKSGRQRYADFNFLAKTFKNLFLLLKLLYENPSLLRTNAFQKKGGQK